MRAKVTLTKVEPSSNFRRPRPYAVAFVAAASAPHAVLIVAPLRTEPDGDSAGSTPHRPPASPLDTDAALFDGEAGPWLAVEGFIADSDPGAQRAGARLDESRHLLQLGVEGRSAGAAGRVISETARMARDLLARSGDDVLATFSLRVPALHRAGGNLRIPGTYAAVTIDLQLPDAPAAEATSASSRGGGERAAPAAGKLQPASGTPVAVDSGEAVPGAAAVQFRTLGEGEVLKPGVPTGPARAVADVDPRRP